MNNEGERGKEETIEGNRMVRSRTKKLQGNLEDSGVEDLPYHQMVLESIRDAFFTLDGDMKFVHFNNRAEKLLGRKREEVVGKHIFNDAFPEARGSIFEMNYMKALEKREGSSFEVFFDREPYVNWYDVKVYPLSDGIAVFFNVTTEQRQREKELESAYERLLAKEQQLKASNQQLRASEQQLKASNQQLSAMNQQLKASEISLKNANERFNLAMEASNDGIYDWNLVTNEIYYSPGWKRMLGYEDDELPNDFSIWEELTDPEDAKRSWKMQQELVNGGRDRFEMELRMRHRDGHWVDILSRAEAVCDRNGKAVRIVGTHFDLTHRKLVEDALNESETRVRNILENSTNMFYSHDTNHVLNFVSQQCRDILGYDPDEVMRNWTDMASDHPVNEIAMQLTEKALETGERQPTYELQLVRKDGRKIWVEVRESPRVVDGKVTEIIGSLNDVTERKSAEDEMKKKNRELIALNQQLMASEEQMKKTNIKLAGINRVLKEKERMLSDTGKMAKVGGWELDTKTNKVTWSEETYRIHEVPMGMDPPLEDAINFFHPDDRPVLKEALEKAMEEGEPYDLELRFITARGKQLITRTNCKPVCRDNRVVKLHGTFQDITKLKLVEMEIEKAKEEVEFYMDLLGHDLGNIHQGISGSLQLLEGRIETDGMTRKILNLATDSVNNATTLTKEVVLLSRLRNREPEREELRLDSILEDVIEQMTATFPEKEIDFEIDRMEHIIKAEPLIRELFINILHNAIRLQNGKPWIRMYSSRKNDRIHISLEDKGPGIPDSMKKELFKRFGLKGEKTRRGLGLSIAKVLAERYGGNISVEDRVEGDHSQGVRFIVDLPTE